MAPARVSLVMLGLLLPAVASCASPPKRYQSAVIEPQAGVACFGVPDTPETRLQAPAIAGISVMEVGTGGSAMWERDFLREGSPGPRLAPGRCLRYGEGGTLSVTPLLPGRRYQVELWGSITVNGAPQSRWFNGYFCMVDVAGVPQAKAIIRQKSGALPWDACDRR